jgi:putative hydrolase of the HAD superfamily
LRKKKPVVPYKHIFFDLDRTLWDFESNSRETLTGIFEKHSLNQYFPSPEPFILAYHKHNEILWNQYRAGHIKKETLRSQRFELSLLEAGIINPELARALNQEYIITSTHKTVLFPFTHEILNYLLEKYSLHILTNGFRETQLSKMKNCDLSKYFKNVFTSETIGYNKPHPKIFHWAMSSVNGRKDECLMVGDDIDTDILGAKSAGMDQAFFNPHRIITEVKSTFEINSLIELKKFL